MSLLCREWARSVNWMRKSYAQIAARLKDDNEASARTRSALWPQYCIVLRFGQAASSKQQVAGGK